MKQLLYILLTIISIFFLGCDKQNAEIKHDTVTITNSDTLVYSIGFCGDEEGASIIKDLTHFEFSKIQRDYQYTEKFYTYKADSNYVGLDYVEIKSSWGSDGSGPSTQFLITKLSINVIE